MMPSFRRDVTHTDQWCVKVKASATQTFIYRFAISHYLHVELITQSTEYLPQTTDSEIWYEENFCDVQYDVYGICDVIVINPWNK